LFSREIDLSVFLGSAVASLLLLAIGWQLGILNEESPDWTWISAVLLVDVAHVWATGFRVYFDPAELKRRVWLYSLVPLFGYLVGVALYSESANLFWRVLAYVAVFHFVRQQYGWVRLYRGKLKEQNDWGKWIDTAAIYLATVYPLIYWHANLPRNFQWFVQNDFSTLPQVLEKIAFPIYVLALSLYALKSIYLALFKNFYNPGKDIVVLTTAVCWYLGIVQFDSDYAFTVTNVIIHGVPYFAIVWFYAKAKREAAAKTYRLFSSNIVFFLSILWLLAYAEEILWHRSVWHEREWLFGASWNLEDWKMYFVPLLALPQITHYVLDGFIWRRKSNQNLRLIER
ncbi:MAG TPA: hypothetical protein VEQ34_03015, partial [Pyrinomonadaceae bacterium]|nr:hypothetical protein [Pyrinomonadaceae bacterium]